MADQQACCICSALLDTYDPTTEKAIIPDRHLSCCGRIICLRCINQNARFKTYCPYCQISSIPSALPQGLKDPPSYHDSNTKKRTPEDDDDATRDSPDDCALDSVPPPAYTPSSWSQTDVMNEKHSPPAEDVLHFLHPHDTVPSLALSYSIPIPELRRANNLWADNLLRGRKTVLIPGAYLGATGGVSLSPQPVDGEEEELRKGRVRRWMLGTKCAEYDVAQLYLEQADLDVDAAVSAFKEDEAWERDHPLEKDKGRSGKQARNSKSVGMRRFVGNNKS